MEVLGTPGVPVLPPPQEGREPQTLLIFLTDVPWSVYGRCVKYELFTSLLRLRSVPDGIGGVRDGKEKESPPRRTCREDRRKANMKRKFPSFLSYL